MAEGSHLATMERLVQDEDFVVAVDQTGLSVTDHGWSKGFGPAGHHTASQHARGLQVMSGLAVKSDGSVLGLCAQSWWQRKDELAPDWHDDDREVRDRESSLWHDVLDQTQRVAMRAGVTGTPWFQMDRGADSYHLLRRAHDEGLRVTIRSAYDRALSGGEKRMREVVSQSKVLGGVRHYLDAAAAKRAGHSAQRSRNLSVRAMPLSLRLTQWRPRRELTSASIWVVHVREKNPPKNAERIEWYLQTTYPIETRADAMKVVEMYRLRWRIEEFHKTWKSGACQMSTSQLRSPANFKRWATIQAAVASRIERFKHVSRNSPDTPASEIASRSEIDAAILLTPKCRWQPGADLTAAEFVGLVANLGGYTGKSSGGPPGSIVLRRGFEDVELSARTIEMMAERKM